MFRRRDIPPVLLLLLLIILVMLTLSQILVVHNGHYGRNVLNMRKLQLELRQMDVNLHALMMQNVPSIELNRRILQNQINTHRFAQIISQASNIEQGNNVLELPSSRFKYEHLRVRINTDVPIIEEESLGTPGIHASQSMSLQASSDGYTSNNHRVFKINGAGKTQHFIPDTGKPHWGLHASNGSNFNVKQLKNDKKTGDLMDAKAKNISFNQDTNNYCPSIPPSLSGRVGVDLDKSSSLTWDDVARENPEIELGGTWTPADCVARHRVAIIVPYRDREPHLMTLLYYLHPILQRQQLEYRLYVVEQDGKDTFNKARIMNVAFVEALKQQNFQCFVFHDVDLVPEYDTNMYSCPNQPRHMSVAIDEMGYKLAYQELVGGVLNMRTEHFQRVNGYSNLYWGWGAEDDDMAYRIIHVGLKITRPPEEAARYKMAKHTKRKPADWRKRAKLLYTGTRRFQFDGLNSLQYNVISINNKPLYTHMLVNIGRPPWGF